MSSHLRRLAAAAAMVVLGGLVGCTGASAGIGGGGAFISFTIGGKTYTFTLGNQGVFTVQAGGDPARSAVQVQNLFETTESPTDRPTAGQLLLEASQVRVTPLGTDKAVVPMQGITGTYNVLVSMADAAETSPCSNGTEVGTFQVTVTGGVVSLDVTRLDLPGNVLEAAITGAFSICLEVSGDADATVVIDSLGIQFAETVQPADNDNTAEPGEDNDNDAGPVNGNDNAGEEPAENDNAGEEPAENDNEGEPTPPADAVQFAPAVRYGLPV